MLEVEVFGWAPESAGPPLEEVRSLCRQAAAAAEIDDGHVAVEFVDEARITELNAAHRGLARPTDVLSFPIDGIGPLSGAGSSVQERPSEQQGGALLTRELGDVVICPEHTSDLREAIVHGMLHLLGMDHEADDGEMLALQRRLLERAGG
jgi:probable rRNA maturation factor